MHALYIWEKGVGLKLGQITPRHKGRTPPGCGGKIDFIDLRLYLHILECTVLLLHVKSIKASTN